MSTFSKSTFDAVKYAACRPSYPAQLYTQVLSLAAPFPSPPQKRVMVDLGCGPGLSTFSLVDSKEFGTVIGVDPSKGMVEAARGIERERKTRVVDVRFAQGFGEDLGTKELAIGDGEVDLIVAGQAAHWFDYEKTYKEMRRVLKPGGTYVFWGYGECFFPNNPRLSENIPKYSGGKLGPYWQQPGRSIVEALLDPVPWPSNSPNSNESASDISEHGQWDPSSFKRVKYDLQSGETSDTSGTHYPLLLKHEWDMEAIEGYLRTWSSAHTYDEKHPGSDVAGEFVEVLKKGLEEEGVDWKSGQKITCAWKLGITSGKKAL